MVRRGRSLAGPGRARANRLRGAPVRDLSAQVHSAEAECATGQRRPGGGARWRRGRSRQRAAARRILPGREVTASACNLPSTITGVPFT